MIPSRQPRTARAAFMLIEALVYMSVLMAVLVVGYAALQACLRNAASLRGNAADIAAVLHAGERWRADLRESSGTPRRQSTNQEETLALSSPQGEITYRFATNAVYRRLGNGPWTRVLEHVQASTMQPDPRATTIPWRWELELQTNPRKFTRVRPLFTFIAVPPGESLK